MYGRAMLALVMIASLAGCSVIEGDVAKPSKQAAENTGYLELTVNVRNAEVYIDGSLYGMVKRADKPQAIVIPAGTHELMLKKFSYEDVTAKIGVEAGAVNTLVLEMKRLPTEEVALPGDKPPVQAEK